MFLSTAFLLPAAIIAAVFSSFSAIFFNRFAKISKLFWCTLLGISGITAILSGVNTLVSPPELSYQLNSGIANIIWSFKLDALSGFFISIVGIIVLSVAIYSGGYTKKYEKQKQIQQIMFFTGLFVVGIYLVLLWKAREI